ncbi:MAG TPA: glycosyl hydrolase family 79 C-terminal domain-containing protein [Solirubrobacteraceae bacterium]|nr:glycosyl hydrolase family 79 C-terminal domain-containing protein [Solirubrobacteraceae bacterium]
MACPSCLLVFLAVLAQALPVLSPDAARADTPQTVSASVGAGATGQPMGPGFVGVSMEYSAVHDYTGSDPLAIDPVLVHLLRALAPGQQPVLRIGGNSSDQTWWPLRGQLAPPGIRYTLTPGWARTTQALARATHAHLILGINLAAGRPALAAEEARALVQSIGRSYIAALEIGNEPDVYNQFPWYVGRGLSYYARPQDYDLSLYIQDFTRWGAAMPSLPLAGPAFAELTWLSGLGQFIAAEPRVGIVTVHRYPLRGCVSDPIVPGFASIDSLLADSSSSGMAQTLAPYVQVVHGDHLPFRVGEMNSASCKGRLGVSNTFAASLWVLDTLFNLAAIGVDGVNVHTLPGAPYELFSFQHTRRGWRAFVHPEYYGMLLFAQAFPPGAQLLPVSAPSGPVKIWATRSSTGRTRIVLINKSTTDSADVTLQVPAAGGAASLEWLRAPSVSATAGVTLGGRGFGHWTSTGVLPRPRTTPIRAVSGSYTITLPAASAVLLTQ